MTDGSQQVLRLLSSDSNSLELNLFVFKIFILIAILLSLISSFYIIIIYACYPKTRNFAFKMVFYLCIADCCFSLAELLSLGRSDFLFDVQYYRGVCYTQSFMITWFGLSSIVWTSIIAWTLYSTVILNNINIENKEGHYLLLGFLLPMAAALLPFITGDYGTNGPLCWFKAESGPLKRTLLEMGFLYIELWFAFIFNTFIIYKVIGVLKMVGVTSDRSWVIKLRFYPLILIICWIWGTVHKLYGLLNPESDEKEIVWLAFLHLFFCSLQGVFNAIIYGLNASVIRIMKRHFCSCFYWRDPSQLESISNAVEMEPKRMRDDSISSAWSERESTGNINLNMNSENRQKIDSLNIKEITEYVLN